MSPAEAISILLSDRGLGVTPRPGLKNMKWPIFISSIPENPDEVICLYDTAGIPDGRMMESGEQIIHPGVQIRVRSNKYQDGWEKCEAIGRHLDSLHRQQITRGEVNYIIHSITRRPTIAMGREQDGTRQNFSINITFTWTNDIAPAEANTPANMPQYLEVNP